MKHLLNRIPDFLQRGIPLTRRQTRIQEMPYEQQVDMAVKESLKDFGIDVPYNYRYRNQRHNLYQELIKTQLAYDEQELLQKQLAYDEQEQQRLAIEESLKDLKREQNKREEKLNQQIRTDQNDEYDILIQQTIESHEREKREKTLQQQLEEAEKIRMNQEKEKINQKIEKIKEMASKLPPEPETGIIIAVVLPNQKRITRKFDPKELGMDVFTWVSSDDSIINDETYVVGYDLQSAFLPNLDPEKSLSEQGIKGRVLFRVQQK